MRKPMFFALFAPLFIIASLIAPRSARANEPPHTIAVQGSGEVTAEPDEAIVTLRIVRFAPALEDARRDHDARLGRIMALAQSFSIPRADVRTSRIEMTTVHESTGRNDDYDLKLTTPVKGYILSTKIAIRIRSLERFDAFRSELMKAGASDIDNVEFGSSEARKHRDAARRLGLQAAREKAADMAAALGQTIGKAVNISEERYTLASNSSQAATSYTEDGKLFSPGSISYFATVNVTFELH